MKYIALAAYKNELILISDMDAFTMYFCYSKKQRHGQVLITPTTDDPDDTETQIPLNEIMETDTADEDDL